MPTYKFIRTVSGLERAIKSMNDTASLDFETTSLSPATGEVRLAQIYDGRKGYVIDFFQIEGRFGGNAHLFEGRTWIVYNSKFELSWFLAAGAKVRCRDVAYLRAAVLGGGRYRLAQCVEWDLKREMDKTEQTSDWGADMLTDSQLAYAWKDAVDTWDLYQHWMKKSDKRQREAWYMFDDLVPAIMEMQEAGMLLEEERHAELVREWEGVQAAKLARIREIVPEEDLAKVSSDAQWSDFFAKLLPDEVIEGWPRTEKTGRLSMTTETLRALAVEFDNTDPGSLIAELMEALADWKKITKYISSFGDTVIQAARREGDGRIRANFNIAAARTGRFSSSGPNLQQMPRDNELLGTPTSVRSSFIAPKGRRLVSLDYSGIELRVLALLANDAQLLADVVEGDVHSEVAAVIAGHEIDKSTPEGKAARSKAKGVSFGIIYGSQAPGLSVNMKTTVREAQKYIDFWATRYANAFDYRNKMMDEARKTRSIRVADGGSIYLGRRPEMPKCANYPVQRAALSIMARAIIRHKRTLDVQRGMGRQLHTLMLSTIHDALIDEASSRDAKKCLSLMETDMVAGYLDVFPGAPTEKLVEGGIGTSWGNLE